MECVCGEDVGEGYWRSGDGEERYGRTISTVLILDSSHFGGARERICMTDDVTGTLQLAVQARAFNNYFYLDAANTIHPARFIPNKVAGILFENKVDYASTYYNTAI